LIQIHPTIGGKMKFKKRELNLSLAVLDRQSAEQVIKDDGQVGSRAALVNAAIITCQPVSGDKDFHHEDQ
jgi:hypothetical protein